MENHEVTLSAPEQVSKNREQLIKELAVEWQKTVNSGMPDKGMINEKEVICRMGKKIPGNSNARDFAQDVLNEAFKGFKPYVRDNFDVSIKSVTESSQPDVLRVYLLFKPKTSRIA